ncbi:MAG: hypothetical protein GXO22_07475 [Aquificae bacterium]|nr:hypothetical protein [Aquificota bacterium]
MNQYLKEIEEFYLKLKKSTLFLTPKEREIILKWYRKKIPAKTVKEVIKQEFVKFPIRKTRKFSLVLIDKRLNQLTKTKSKKVDIPKNSSYKESNYEENEKRISLVWKELSKKEKEQIKREAFFLLKELRLSKKEYKEALKVIIKKLVEEKYL